jgi:hypothetical protein
MILVVSTLEEAGVVNAPERLEFDVKNYIDTTVVILT